MFSQPSYIIDQGCQTRELLGTILHVGNRVEDRMMFFDLEIFASSGNGFCNVARRVIDLQKKVIRGKEGNVIQFGHFFLQNESTCVQMSSFMLMLKSDFLQSRTQDFRHIIFVEICFISS